MPKTKKKWIDKKNAVTFHLVHRSQQDPLAADDSAPQRVLLAAPSSQSKSKKQKEEEMKYGIYFDDDYDYLQHLRENDSMVAHWEETPEREKPQKENKIKLPSSVFASEVQEDVGLLNKAAPQSGLRLDLDPDIVAAMDEDFDFEDPENQLEDDFILKANASGDEYSEDEGDDDEYIDSDDLSEDEGSVSTVGGRSKESDDTIGSFRQEETKSRFTEFSMSSSVVPRNDQLTLLDDRFEKMFAEYDENEIGALDCEEIEGEINPADDMVLRLAEEEFDTRSKVPDPEGNNILLSDSDTSSLEDERFVLIEEKEKWDCESILSTYSNIYNHPKLITEPKVSKIKISSRTGMPVADDRLTAKNLARLGGEGGKSGPGSVISALSTLSIRNKDETPEEKKQRKTALKQYRKERRIERKINSSAFKEEKKRQEKNMMNARVNTVAVHL
ncbi:protein LTV1 homolog [Macrosteles quadrilineatus]|uniref:protein LTV1 homolog n=1 Tax=Macrosteles quadrilineatus TaxID=74068 RepID=UPI0023E2A11A|nr:protein LTV1 homolog [Macrosteles quadrilineatus]